MRGASCLIERTQCPGCGDISIGAGGAVVEREVEERRDGMRACENGHADTRSYLRSINRESRCPRASRCWSGTALRRIRRS